MKPTIKARIAIATILLIGSGLSLGTAVVPVLAAGGDTFLDMETDLAQQSRPGRPPREAMEACAEKASGDACSFTGPKGPVSGTCRTPKSSAPAACVPEGMGPKG